MVENSTVWASSSNSYSSYDVEYSLPCDGIQEDDQNSRCRSLRSFILYLFGHSKRRVIPITYPVFQGRLRDLVAKTGRNAASFSSHSMRRGGIQLAFKAEVKTELIQQHGDWVSDCYKEYLTYDFEQKLSVSKKMCSTIIKTL